MNESARAEESGFAGLRGSADDTMLQYRFSWAELIRGEHMLSRFIYSKKRNLSALCMYDAGTLTPEGALRNLLDAHSEVVFPGLAINLSDGGA